MLISTPEYFRGFVKQFHGILTLFNHHKKMGLAFQFDQTTQLAQLVLLTEIFHSTNLDGQRKNICASWIFGLFQCSLVLLVSDVSLSDLKKINKSHVVGMYLFVLNIVSHYISLLIS